MEWNQFCTFIFVLLFTFSLTIPARADNNTTMTCGGKINDTAIIQSPNYPSSYPNNVTCSWVVAHPYGQNVVFNFTHFDTEQCCDYVEIRDYDNTLYRLSGKSVPQTIYVYYKGTVTFKTDASGVASGFSFTVNFTTASYTKTENLVGSGVITTLNYPQYYPKHINCYWNLMPNTLGDIVRITFEVYEIGEPSSISIYDNAGRYLYWYGYMKQPSFIDLSGGGSLVFRPSGQAGHKGISANFTSLEPLTESECHLNNNFWCSVSRKCIHRSWLCDRYVDCIHKEDMDSCPYASTVWTFDKGLSGSGVALIVVGTIIGSIAVICVYVNIVHPILKKARRGVGTQSEDSRNGQAPSADYITASDGRSANIEARAHDGLQTDVLSDEMPPSYEHARKQSSSARGEEDLPSYDSAIFTQN